MNQLQVMRTMRKNLTPMIQANRDVRTFLIHLVQYADQPDLLQESIEQLRASIKYLDDNEFLLKKLIGS